MFACVLALVRTHALGRRAIAVEHRSRTGESVQRCNETIEVHVAVTVAMAVAASYLVLIKHITIDLVWQAASDTTRPKMYQTRGRCEEALRCGARRLRRMACVAYNGPSHPG